MDATRRRFLRDAILGSAGLRALATGLPLSLFTSGFPTEEALAAEATPRQFLILLGSSAGDPFNANAPGCYGVDGVVTNPHPEMAPVALRIGEQTHQAAAPWAQLPQWVLDRSSFIHHRTYQNAHPQFKKVLGLVGSAKSVTGSGSEQLASVISSENARALETVQVEPVALTGSLTFEGRVLQRIRPRTLSSMFRKETGTALELENLRADTMDSLHHILREGGTPAQKRWIDRYAASHEQVRQLDESLLERLDSIDSDDAMGQIDAALTLILMRISPVIHIRIPFGGDNHRDAGLIDERDETVTGMQAMKYLFEQLDALGLRDKVTVANLNVFGRTLGKKGTDGRDHNLNHHVMMITGPRIAPSVVGGIVPVRRDFGATGIDSVTGQGAEDADIPAEQTLESAAKTLATALEMPSDRIDHRIKGGKVIQASLTD